MRIRPWLFCLLLPCLLASGKALPDETGPLPICGAHVAANEPCATRPVAIHPGSAHYTEEARRAELEGVVALGLVIDETGLPRDIRVFQSLDKGLDEQAVSAVRESRWTPGTYQGRPVAVIGILKVHFTNCKSYGIEWPETATGDYVAAEGDPAALKTRLQECKKPVRTGKDWQCPLLLRVRLPDVEEAQKKNVHGVVVLSMTIDQTGRSGDVYVLQPLDPGFDEQAIAAVKQWLYRPAWYHGHSYPVRARIQLRIGRCEAARADLTPIE